MDALDALLNRTSSPRLGGSEPPADALNNIFKAALRAPDHALLRPWRFLLVRGDARLRLGELFAGAEKQDDPEIAEALLEKTRAKPLRAPLIVVVIARVLAHPKVPEVEQLLSAGAAVENMMLAAFAQGVGAMWRTGGMAYHPFVHKGLGLLDNEQIVGFLYLGEVQGKDRNLLTLAVDDYFEDWGRS